MLTKREDFGCAEMEKEADARIFDINRCSDWRLRFLEVHVENG